MIKYLLHTRSIDLLTSLKLCLIGIFIFCASLSAIGQNLLQLETGVAFQIAGQANSTYDFFAKTGFQHIFSSPNQFSPYGRVGWLTNISSNYARLQVADLTTGLRWNNRKYNPWMFIEADLGGLYWDEHLISDLKERKIQLDLNQIGIKARFAVGLYCFERGLLELCIEQLHNEATLLSLNFGFEF